MSSLSAGTVSLGVRPDATGFGAKLSEGILGESGMLAGVGKHLGGLIMGGLAAVGIATGIGEIVKKGVEEYSKADALNAQFTAGIKSTGNAANLSVKGMDELAASISGYSGQTYDSIGKTEQLLQTFTNVKNVGPNKIFDQATEAAANMAAKMGGDASQSAIQLGIALNDPTKGIARLHRVGVAFTQSQTDQIKAMQASGNIMGAQKIILAELATEFGGAAKAAGQTLPGEIARSKVAFGELTKAIMTGVMPFVTPVIEGIANAMIKATPFVEHFSDAFREKLGPVVQAMHGPLVAFGNVIHTVFAAAKPVVEKLGETFKPVLESIGAAFAQIGPVIAPLLPQIVSLASSMSPLNLVFKAIAPVLPTIISSLAGLAVMLAGALGSALSAIMPVLTTLVGILATQFMGIVKTLIPVIVQLVSVIGPILGTVLKAAVPLITLVAQFIGQLFTAIAPLIPVVLSLVMAFVPLLEPLIQLAAAILTPLIQLFTAILVPVMGLVTGLVQFLVPAVNLIIQVITWLITNVIAGAKIEFKVLGDVIAGIGSVVGTVFGAIGDVIRGAFNGVVEFVRGIFNTIIGVVNGVIDGINGAAGLVKTLSGGAIDVKLSRLPKLADSGTVLPKPGGTLALVAEGGKAESVVDTGKLNGLMDAARSGGGSGMPGSVTLLDADGSILARTHVIAKTVSTRTLNASMRGA